VNYYVDLKRACLIKWEGEDVVVSCGLGCLSCLVENPRSSRSPFRPSVFKLLSILQGFPMNCSIGQSLLTRRRTACISTLYDSSRCQWIEVAGTTNSLRLYGISYWGIVQS
jgi:hypothetical protein